MGGAFFLPAARRRRVQGTKKAARNSRLFYGLNGIYGFRSMRAALWSILAPPSMVVDDEDLLL